MAKIHLPPDSLNPKVIQSVALSLRILENLADCGEEKGVTQIARELGTTKARIFRHLQTLRELGYVIQNDKTQKDRIGVRLYLLGRLVGENVELTQAVKPSMGPLRDNTGQTAVFSTELDGKMVILDFELGTTPVKISLKPGTSFEIHATALGRIALAYGPETLWHEVEGGGLPPQTQYTIQKADELKDAIATVRNQGWATAPQETLIGINAIAAPVFYHDGSLAGALGIFGSLQYIPEKPSEEQIAQVRQAARIASQTLGWRG